MSDQAAADLSPKRSQLAAATQRLIEEYRGPDPLSERQLAQLGARVWGSLSKAERSATRRSAFLAEHLGGTTHYHSCAQRLAGAGDEARELWQWIQDRRLTMGTAARLLQQARRVQRAAHDLSRLREHVAEQLRQLEGAARVGKGPDGRRRYYRKAASSSDKPGKKPAAKSSAGHRAGGAPSRRKERPERQLYASLRQLIYDYLKTELATASDDEAREIAADFELDVQLSLELLVTRLQRQRRYQGSVVELAEATERRKLREAYQALSLSPPTRRAPVSLRRVKRQFRRLAKVYHPDRQPPGADVSAVVPKFQAVTDAYHFICDYCRRTDTP